MRPQVLRMQAFGPYKTSETIDFTDLGANKLFLIHGDTGAGKTSILDGIVFALYGDTSGGERQAAQMRCESADPALPTEVELTFALGRRTFRVLRSPKQDIAARGGGRLVTKQASAALWETTDAEPGGEGKVLGTKIREVNDAVRDLLGFSSEQFRQVVVLPQGKFRDLLAAGSDKREEILKQLFRTEGCADLERRLRERARDVVKQREELQIARRTRLEAAGAEDDATLEALTSQAATSAAALKREAAKAEKLAVKAAKTLSEAEKADEAAGAVVEAEGELERLTAQQPHIDELKAAAERARDAEKVTPLAAALDGAVKELGDAEVALTEACTKQTKAVAAEKAAATALQKEEQRAPARTAAAEQVRRLTEMRKKVTAWEKAEGLREEADQVLTSAADELREAQANLKAAKAAQEEAREQVGKAGAAATSLKSAEQKRVQAGKLAEQCAKRDKAEAELGRLSGVRDTAADAYKRAKAAFEAVHVEYAGLEASWRAGRAAALAGELVDGEPCQVCGSTAHPTPARSADEVDDAALDEARERLEEARRLQDGSKDDLSQSEADVSTARGEFKALRDAVPEGLTTVQANADARACEDEVMKLVEAVAAVPDPDEVTATANEAIDTAEKRLTAAQKADRGAASDLAGKRASARELATGIPEELRAPAALERALDEAQITSRRLEGELKAAQDESITARENKVAAEGGAKAAAGTEVAAKRRVTTARKSFSAALGQHGFETAEAYEAAVIPEEDLLEAEDQVTTHRDALNGAKGQLKQARASVKEHPVQGDVDSFRERSLVAAAESREAQRLQNDADNRLASLKDARGALDELDEQFEEVTASYAIIGKLAEVAAGQSDGAKVSFQRWVLGRYLDDVLLAASRRLVTMSSDRYRLQRQKEASDLRRPSGLELAVFDGWSNRARPAITLSGGESFLAALSLALGLAETVQEQSGATPLETIFVDEGFGALDQNALEQAMDALTELKDSGRLVGVITHVPELRQVIDARLEVRGGPGGSSTQFFVP